MQADAGGFVYLGDLMEAIGKTLKEARERLGLTLDEVARSTRIRKVRLEALENGDFDSLPSRVQVQGFLRNYADFLGLDPEQILSELAQLEGRGAKRKARVKQPSGEVDRPYVLVDQPRRFRITGDQIITGFVAIAVIALLIWGSNRIISSLNQPAEPTSDATMIPEPTMTYTPSSTPQLAGLDNPATQIADTLEPTFTATLPLGLVDSIELELEAVQSTFVQVFVDGVEAFQGRMLIGERRTFRGEDRVEVVTGNARGLRVYFNGIDQGFLGQVNQVLTRVWTIRGMQTPTPTQTLTPTASPPVTETPTPTITPVALGGE